MEIKVIKSLSDIDMAMWDNFVFNHPNSNFFQSPLAFDFFSNLSGYQPFLIAATQDNELKGVLSAVLINEHGIKKFFSRRCIVWGGPLCYDIKTADKLIHKLVEYTKSKSIYTEIRNLFSVNGYDAIFKEHKFEFIEWLNYIVPVEEIEKVRKRLNDSKRRQISKSLKVGAKILEAKNIQEVTELFQLLSNLYKTKIKKPLPPFEFFEKFFTNKSFGKIFIVEYNGRIIGGTVCPIFNDKIYEWYVCGIDKEIKDVYPSVLATWAPIEFAAKNGFKLFDFLGAGSPNSDYGVREFKSQFGGELVSFGRYLSINNPLLYKVGKLGLLLSQKPK